MENHGLGTHNDKKCAEISTGITPNTTQFIRPICPNRPIIWNKYFKKNPHHMSIVHGQRNLNLKIRTTQPGVAGLSKFREKI